MYTLALCPIPGQSLSFWRSGTLPGQGLKFRECPGRSGTVGNYANHSGQHQQVLHSDTCSHQLNCPWAHFSSVLKSKGAHYYGPAHHRPHCPCTIITVFTLIKRKIQFMQENSKIAVILNNAHRIFSHRNFTRACMSYGNAYPISARNSLFRKFYDSNKRDSYLFFFACVFIRIKTVCILICQTQMM